MQTEAPKSSETANLINPDGQTKGREHPHTLPQSTHGLTGISNTFYLVWLDRCLTFATERRQADGPWPYREKIFDASHLWHDWFSFSSPSLWEVARAGSVRPGAPWPPTCGRCEAGNRWRQKPQKSIGPCQSGASRTSFKNPITTCIRCVVWVHCTLENTMNFPLPWLIYLFGAALYFPHWDKKPFTFKSAREWGKWVLRLDFCDIIFFFLFKNRKNSLETIWIAWNK